MSHDEYGNFLNTVKNCVNSQECHQVIQTPGMMSSNIAVFVLFPWHLNELITKCPAHYVTPAVTPYRAKPC